MPVAVLSVLWTSINPKEHKKLSALKVRRWPGQLLDRSILIGNSGGVSMHDVSKHDRHPATRFGSPNILLRRL